MPRRIIETEINNNTRYPVAEEGAIVVYTFRIVIVAVLRLPMHIVAK